MGKKKVLLAKTTAQSDAGREASSPSVESSSSSNHQNMGSWAVAEERNLAQRAEDFRNKPGSGQIMMASDSGSSSGVGSNPVPLLSRSTEASSKEQSPSLGLSDGTRLLPSGKHRMVEESKGLMHDARRGRNEPSAMLANDLEDSIALSTTPSLTSIPSNSNALVHGVMDEVFPTVEQISSDTAQSLEVDVGTSSTTESSSTSAPLTTSTLEGESFARVQPQPISTPSFRDQNLSNDLPSNARAAENSNSAVVPSHLLGDIDLGASVKSVISESEKDKGGDANDRDEEVCFICMEGFNMNPRWTLECQCQVGISNPISVHARCIRKWKLCGKNSLCPLCRQPLPDTNVLSFQIPESLSSSLRFQKFIRASQRNILENSDFNTMIPRIVNNWMHEHPFPPQEASKEEVVDLLVQTGLQQYADCFFLEEINGQIFGTFEREDLVDLGVETDLDIDRFMAVLKVLKGNSVCVHGMMM